MEAGAHWPVAASPEKKLGLFVIIFEFFRIFILSSVNLSRVLHSGKKIKKKKTTSVIGQRRQVFPECQHDTRQSLPRVHDF